ncbi:MAG: FHA domain-containing protein [Myxococcota bacterium]
MAALEHTKTQQHHPLDNPTVIGRSRACGIQISLGHVSSTHAEVRWNGHCWDLRDLDSRNGTFVNGRRLANGERVMLSKGTQIAFGDLSDPWIVFNDGPPGAYAEDGSGRRQRADENGLLVLPNIDHPDLGIYFDGTTWRADSGENVVPVENGTVVGAGGIEWTLNLPEDLRATQEVMAPGDTMCLDFFVSQDEEHIEIMVHRSGQQRRLDHRAHSYLLLTLARERIAQAQDPSIPPSEQGWIYHSLLADQLKMPMNHFNMAVYRARQQFSSVAMGEDQIIERRRGSGQIRIGCGNLNVRPL